MKNQETLIFSVNGGAGKNVMATAVIAELKKEYPSSRIIVVTAYPDIWLFNPNVYRVYRFDSAPYFYKDYIEGKKNVRVFNLEPYQSSDFITKKKKSLIETWCEMYGIEYTGEKPAIYFNDREIEFFKNNFLNRIPGGKYMVIQTNGGGPSEVKYSWFRDLKADIAKQVVDYSVNEFKMPVFHIRREDQIALNNTERFTGSNLREVALLIRFSSNRLFIDSLPQHLANALEKPSTVVWIGNDPAVFGYKGHDNIVPDKPFELTTVASSVFEQFDITGNIYQYPFPEGTEIFDVEKIVNSLKNQ